MSGCAGAIFDIKKFAIHDGPGIRTTVFLKGCPLSCPWCHNPESQEFKPQLVYRDARCLGCGECLEACPESALSQKDGSIVRNENLCVLCGSCAGACPSEALEIIGREMTAGEVIEEVKANIFSIHGL